MFGCGSSVCIKPCTTLDYPYVEASVEVVQQRVKEKSQVEEEQDFVFFFRNIGDELTSILCNGLAVTTFLEGKTRNVILSS